MSMLLRLFVFVALVLSPAIALSAQPMVAAGTSHTLAIKSDGTVWAWGGNSAGQLGNGSTADGGTPNQVSGISGGISIAGGGAHSVALRSDHTVWTWGSNASGQLGNLSNVSSSTPVQAGISGVTAIAAGASHTVALKSDGTVWSWGLNSSGQLGNGFTTSTNTPVQASGLTGVTAIAAGANHTLALKSDGTVWAWGANGAGQLGNGSFASSFVPTMATINGVNIIASGGSHNLVRKSDGTIWAWGANASGQLGGGAGADANSPVQVAGITGFPTVVAAGSAHSVALKSDGTVWGWGANADGQMGNGSTTDAVAPVQAILTGLQGVASGASHVVALKTDGTVGTWGSNASGQLGNGSTTSSSNPAQVLGPGGIGVFTLTVSSNASLAGLTLSSGTLSPVFSGSTTAYTASVSGGISSITLTPTLADSGASVTVNGVAVTSGSASQAISLPVGNTTITVLVTAQDGATTKSYTVTVTRPTSSSNANLSGLAISSGSLTPAFSATTTAYAVSVANSVATVTLTPTLAESGATVTVNGATVVSGSASAAIALAVGGNAVVVQVTAQDRVTTKTYTVTITRATPSSSATLISLALSSGSLVPAFSSTNTVYTASVANSVATLKLIPIPADGNATVKVNGAVVASGSASSPVNLAVGSNVITVQVIAQDGATTKDYTVTVTRQASSSLPYLSLTNLSKFFTSLPQILDMSSGDGHTTALAMASTLSTALAMPVSYQSQSSSGALLMNAFNNGKLAFMPVAIQTGDARSNGLWYNASGNGQYDVVTNGTAVTVAPALVNPVEVAGLLSNAVLQMDRNGVINARFGGVTYIVQPSYTVQMGSLGPPNFATGSAGELLVTDSAGFRQILYPAFAEADTLRNVLHDMDRTSSLLIQLDGTAKLMLNGLPYTLVPDLNLGGVPQEHSRESWWQDAPNHFWIRNQGIDGTAQGFTVR